MYDVCHLSMLMRDIVGAREIHVLTDDPIATRSIMDKESHRLGNDGYHPQIHKYRDPLSDIKSLVKDTHKRIFISMSGHGYTGIPDRGESDGRGEYINILGARIRDDDIYAMLDSMDRDILLLVDTCGSGTMADLPYVMNHKGHMRRENDLSIRGKIVCISSCIDGAYSRDTLSGTYGYSGYATSLFLDHVDKVGGIHMDRIVRHLIPYTCISMSSPCII